MVFKTMAKFGTRKKPVDRKVIEKAVIENILTRKSIRRYSSKDVSDKEVGTLLLAATHAPSAGNQQPWEFIVVRDYETRKLLAEACYEGDSWIAEAPVLIVACVTMKGARDIFGERGERLYIIQDVAAACENILLAANALGLGSCWVGGFAESKVALLLEIPAYVRPCAIITIGWPEESPDKPARLPLTDVVKHDKFNVLPTRWKEEP